MSEATGHEAKTIHRMLEYSMQKGGFQKDDKDTLDCDLLVIDEASMIDTILMHHLLKAVPNPTTFILVGDINHRWRQVYTSAKASQAIGSSTMGA